MPDTLAPILNRRKLVESSQQTRKKVRRGFERSGELPPKPEGSQLLLDFFETADYDTATGTHEGQMRAGGIEPWITPPRVDGEDHELHRA